jgi:hypothetical protein
MADEPVVRSFQASMAWLAQMSEYQVAKSKVLAQINEKREHAG